ncbi:hypothetical protein MSAN_00737900 [Mycena sanguinolenta]|uniref:F-box domain-containing protein n=1 Tax=Mycena sanguinolenta TaxID=230812 RepID=A0A8H7DFE1_9AGAR|nr:hypothetical protein MSAN_00737900 [Mycena sanguinolenta]
MSLSLTSLGEYLLCLVCLELSLADIMSLRQVCRVLSRTTKAKVLWIYILERQALEETIMPPYLNDYERLNSSTIEALVRRVSRLAHKWETQDLSPVRSWKLHLPLAITWLRLVAGRWLFVASSDSSSSKISCWDLSLIFQGCMEPLAEAYLPGQVKTGKLEVQKLGIVLALGLGPEAQAVHILTLRKCHGCHVFAELCCIQGSSHVLMLSGDVVACALRHGDSVPHIINWMAQRVYDIPPPPDDLNIPCRRSVPHLITTWNGALIIVRRNTLEFYTLPSANDSIGFLKLVQISTTWEAAVLCASPSVSSMGSPLRLITISPAGVEICIIEDPLTGLDSAGGFCLDPTPNPEHRTPWYRLSVGQAGRRFLRISFNEVSEFDSDGFPKPRKPPHFTFSTVPSQSCGLLTNSPRASKVPRIVWDTDGEPALWAIPTIDFDEALGLTVVGNIFGELAIYDHVGQHPERCTDLSIDLTDQKTAVPPLLPTTPLKLDLPVAPTLKIVATQTQAGETTWIFMNYDHPGYYELSKWYGEPCDEAWILEHAYGFPGRVLPQAFQRDPLSDGCQTMLFRVGSRYFAFRHDEYQLLSFTGTPSGYLDVVDDGQVETYSRPTAMTERDAFLDGKVKQEGWGETIEDTFDDEDYPDPRPDLV